MNKIQLDTADIIRSDTTWQTGQNMCLSFWPFHSIRWKHDVIHKKT